MRRLEGGGLCEAGKAIQADAAIGGWHGHLAGHLAGHLSGSLGAALDAAPLGGTLLQPLPHKRRSATAAALTALTAIAAIPAIAAIAAIAAAGIVAATATATAAATATTCAAGVPRAVTVGWRRVAHVGGIASTVGSGAARGARPAAPTTGLCRRCEFGLSHYEESGERVGIERLRRL